VSSVQGVHMPVRNTIVALGFLFVVTAFAAPLHGQISLARYERAFDLQNRLQPLVVDLPDQPVWIGETSRFWYSKTTAAGRDWVVVDAATLQRRPAFDHEQLAAALSLASGRTVDPLELPFRNITFDDSETGLTFVAFDQEWDCRLAVYQCTRIRQVEPGPAVNPVGIYHRGPQPEAASRRTLPSPDGQWEAWIMNYNVHVRSTDGGETVTLSWDGGERDFYDFQSLSWSPDSRKLAAFRLQPGQRRILRYIEAAPADRFQPEYSTLDYTKPGDLVDQRRPVLFHVDRAARIDIDPTLFPNQFDVSAIVWRRDSRAFTFEHNERGHKVFRVIEVDATTGAVRALISEESETFFFYQGRYRGKYFRYDVNDGAEIVWMSERDGWNHLYLHDGRTGSVRNQITRGEWVVQDVDRVDEAARQIWFHASGRNAGQDPYFVHYYRINFDGTGLVALTDEDANHSVVYSADMQYHVRTRSRVDEPPVMELRRTADLQLLLRLEETDISRLAEAGWRPPESFVAKGRDGTTDIWGIIIRPMDFDPARRYPVIESIYAGPQGSSVPKTFTAYSEMRALAELGFIVVQIDGMGTSNRSKAFQDVAYQRLHDAGFLDRILWHRAAAAKYAHYDIANAGIYGGSAGGYSSTAAVLHHPDFYKVAVSGNGNHDHRMDKISFNELFMGWPIGPQYSASSNVDNAWRLRGKLLLIVAEMDTNVDPASTYKVVDVLIRANRTFDLLVLPGGGHNTGGDFPTRARYDYFVRHVLGVEPPNWNLVDLADSPVLSRRFGNPYQRRTAEPQRWF